MPEIILIGGGGHARVVISILKRLPDYDIAGYVDKENKGRILGVEYMGNDAILADIKNNHPDCHAVIALGSTDHRQVKTRKRLYEHLEKLGFTLPVIVSPAAIISEDVHIDPGTAIMDGAIIGTGSRIGKCAIINTRCSVDHDCRIGDYVHIAPGATLSGGVTVGSESLVGAGATVIHHTTIADKCVIGAGAVVIRDCTSKGTYVGVPARLMR